MDNILHVLNVFFLASGLRININKSNVFRIGVSSEEIEDMARLTGCLPGSVPFTYLGLPIGSNMNRLAHWNGLIEKFKSRLSNWMANLLSIGGRSTLIKAVLGSIGIYYMSIFKVPKSITSDIESLRAKFFVWRGCRIQTHDLDKMGKGFSFPCKGWFGYWLDPNPNCVVVDRFVNGEWNLKWSRPIVSGRNLDYLISLNFDLEQILSFTGRDEVMWELGNDATFTVKETREHIDDNILQTLDAPTIWCKSIPRKVNIFLWRLHMDRIPTRLNLSKRGLDIPLIMCPICSNGVESNDHIFYSCKLAASIWRLVNVWCDMHFPNMLSPSAWTSWIDTLRTLNDYRNRIRVIVATTLWTI
nr:reverse transcriptase domain, reverse transcriptase zinc-binding domain protein [Tanacetum cinerariifolium]